MSKRGGSESQQKVNIPIRIASTLVLVTPTLAELNNNILAKYIFLPNTLLCVLVSIYPTKNLNILGEYPTGGARKKGRIRNIIGI